MGKYTDIIGTDHLFFCFAREHRESDQELNMPIISTDWRPSHAESGEEEIFAIGDIHGQADALSALLTHMDAQPKRAARTFIQVGDLIDRGPDSLRACALAMSAQDLCDTRILLPGNHEIMLLLALSDIDGDGVLWEMNGGDAVITQIGLPQGISAQEKQNLIRNAFPEDFLDEIATGPTYFAHEDLLFVHAGIHPHLNRSYFLSEARDSHVHSSQHWAWIRDPFLDWTKGWDDSGRQVVCHGHTPAVGHLMQTPSEVAQHLDKVQTHRRICLDAGAAAGLAQAAMVQIYRGEYRIHIST